VGQDGVGMSINTVLRAVDTTFVDLGLQGNTEYAYRVVTRNTEGEEHPTDWVSGGFHIFVDEWRIGEGYSSIPFAICIDYEDYIYVVGTNLFGPLFSV